MTDEEKDITNPAFFRNLQNIFAEARELLTEKAKEFGIDLAILSDEEYAEIRARERAFIKGEEITKLAEKYAWEARTVLDAKDQWLDGSADDEMLADVIEVIYWYQFFISVKIQRGLHGILDADGDEDTDEIRDSQSDANGSIKVALIAIERSILSWTYLLSPQNSNTIRPLIELLENTKQLTEKKFPNARDFLRPGFDEIETVM
ncbi:MAG: hypothetical protein ABL952_12060 [Pyrinomonadaceae bacterium]